MGDAYDRVTWRGHRFNKRTVAALREVEKRLGVIATIYQGSYSDGSLSAGTHTGGGAVDLWFPGVDPVRQVRVMKNVGFAAWRRGPESVDGFMTHIHALLLGDRELASEAVNQVNDYKNGGNGLYPYSGGDDLMPYRPDPLVVFDYAEWKEAERLRDQIRQLSNDIKALRRRLDQKRAELDKLT